MVNNSRPSIDVLFHSASNVYKEKLLGIVLSGANQDGALGMKIIKEQGGYAVVQDPTECTIDTMVKSTMKATRVDQVLNCNEIIQFLNEK
jgi:two-component system, chemotaxis family, protein-glutamate methylesterase/glutaminase